jgi:hypothetical protein
MATISALHDKQDASEEPVRISELLSELADALQEFEQLWLKLKDMRSAVDEFITEYYTRVGPYLARLENLRCGASVNSQETLEQALRRMPSSSPPSFKAELRKVYRELAKTNHPDQGPVNERQQRQARMQMINHAYSQENLASLWKLSLDQARHSDKTLWQTRLKEIRGNLHHMRRSVEELERSPEYLLMRRAFKARLHGHDLVASVVSTIEQDISKEEKRMQLLGSPEKVRA